MVSINGKPAPMVSEDEFVADVDVQPGANVVSVEARDMNGNAQSKLYQVDVPSTASSYTYDESGNLGSKSDDGHVWACEWTVENQLKRVTKDGVEVARFKYDPLGRRVEKVAGGITHGYMYDGMDLAEARWVIPPPTGLHISPGSGSATYSYVHGPGIDEPLARIDQANNVTYYHADGLGSIVKMTDSTGAVVQTRQYDAWGNLEVGADQPGYAFTGREWDPEIGLYYYRARYYDPKVGRFISEDPLVPNSYAYADGSPVNAIDPLGLMAYWCRRGNKISITIPITYVGELSDIPAITDRFSSAIEQAWTGDFEGLEVTTRVALMLPGNPGNTVSLQDLSFDEENVASVNERGGNIVWMSAYSHPRTAAHEAGHLMGLPDRYDRLQGKDGKVIIVKHKGFEKNIMADIKEAPSRGDIEDIMRASTNTCTCKN